MSYREHGVWRRSLEPESCARGWALRTRRLDVCPISGTAWQTPLSSLQKLRGDGNPDHWDITCAMPGTRTVTSSKDPSPTDVCVTLCASVSPADSRPIPHMEEGPGQSLQLRQHVLQPRSSPESARADRNSTNVLSGENGVADSGIFPGSLTRRDGERADGPTVLSIPRSRADVTALAVRPALGTRSGGRGLLATFLREPSWGLLATRLADRAGCFSLRKRFH